MNKTIITSTILTIFAYNIQGQKKPLKMIEPIYMYIYDKKLKSNRHSLIMESKPVVSLIVTCVVKQSYLMPTCLFRNMFLRVLVYIATLDNISFISRGSVLLVVETEVPGENRRPATSH